MTRRIQPKRREQNKKQQQRDKQSHRIRSNFACKISSKIEWIFVSGDERKAEEQQKSKNNNKPEICMFAPRLIFYIRILFGFCCCLNWQQHSASFKASKWNHQQCMQSSFKSQLINKGIRSEFEIHKNGASYIEDKHQTNKIARRLDRLIVCFYFELSSNEPAETRIFVRCEQRFCSSIRRRNSWMNPKKAM